MTYSANGGASWSLAALDHAGTSITFNVTNSATYLVGVRAKNASGGSGWRNSAPAGPYTPPSPPPPPATVSSVSVERADGTLTASWDASSGATSYHVTYTDNGAQSWQLAAYGHASTSITIAVANGATYIVGVRAKNEAGGSNWRNSAAAGPYTPPSEPPARPSGLTATAGDERVTLSWDDPADASITGYEYRVRWTGVAWGAWTAIAGAVTTATVEGLENGVEHRFKLRAVNGTGASRAAPGGAPWYVAATPDAPTLTAGGATETSAVITLGNWGGAWYYRASENAGASGASGASASGQSGCVGPINGAETTVTGLDPNSSYTINAYAQCGGAAIASASASTLPPAPGAVAKPAAAAKFQGAELTWTAPTTGTVTGYEVQWRPCQVTFSTTCITYTEPPPPQNQPDNRTPVSAWAPWGTGTHLHGSSGEAAVGASASPYTVTGLNNGVRYQLRVRASNTTGNGTSYGPWSTPSDDVWPNMQYSLTATSVTGSEATLTVAVSSGGVPWPPKPNQVWHYDANTGPHVNCQGPVSGASVTVTGLTAHVTYAYRAYTDSGCRDSLAWTSFTTGGDDLTASAVTDTTATLTLANQSAAWYVKKTSPTTPAGTCSSAISTGTHALDSLTPSTAYIYTAYNDATCATMLDSAAFTTLPGSPANLGASISTANVITVDWERAAGETGSLAYTVEHGLSSTWTDCATVAATSDTALSATCTYSGPSTNIPTKVRVRSAKGGANGSWTEGDFVGAPRDLAASYGSGSLTITWKPPEGPSTDLYGYHVESSADGATWTRRHTIAPVSGTTFSRTVSVGGIAEVRVRATSSGDASSWAEADVPAPGSVGAQVRGTTLYVRWEKTAGASGSFSYTISCNNAATGATGWDDTCGTLAATSDSTLTASVANEGSVKRVRVRATQSSVAGPWSAETAVPALVPGAPATLDVTVSSGGGTGGGNALTNVTWTKPSGSTVDYAYEITCSDDNGSTWTYCGATPHTVAAGGTKAVNFFGKDATTNVRVVAVRDNLRGEAATWRKAPLAPGGLGAQLQGTTLKLRWDRPSGATGDLSYTISCNNAASGNTGWVDTCGSVAATSNTVVTASVSGQGSVLRVRVRGVQASVDGAWATVAVPTGVPGAVTGVGAQVQGTTLKLRWERPSGATTALSYAAECNNAATGATGWTSCHTESATSGSVLTASAASQASVVRVRVRAERDGLRGAWTTAAVPARLPGTPASVSLTVIGSSGFASWSRPAGVTGPVTYRIQCSTDNGATWTASPCERLVTTSHASYDFTAIAAGTNAVRVRVERDGLWGAWARSTDAAVSVSYVTNLASAISTSVESDIDATKQAVDFTTGSSPGGYTLTSFTARLRLKTAGTGSLELTLHEKATTGDAPSATALAATFSGTAPTSGAFSNVIYTCSGSGCDLKPSTKYFVVATRTSGTAVWAWGVITTLTETTYPANSGWDIGTSHYKPSNASWSSWLDYHPARLEFRERAGLSMSGVGGVGATLTISGHAGQWWYRADTGPDATCQGPVAANTATKALTGLTGGVTYTYTAYSQTACASSNALAAASAFTMPGLSASGMSETGATLTIAGHTGQWWYEADTGPHATCQGPVAANTATEALTGLTAGTTYTYKAYSASGCASANLLAVASAFTTPGLSASNVTATTATLTIAGHTGNWYVKKTAPTPAGACSSAISGTTHDLTTLAAGTAYTYKAYSDAACSSANEIATATFTTLASLTAGSVGTTSATLTLAGGPSTWYVKETSPSSGTCTTKTAATHALTLTAGTWYVYRAYSGSGCTTEIAAVAFATTVTVGSIDTSSNSNIWLGRQGAQTQSGAQAFTTGSNPGGYTLTSITGRFSDTFGSPGGIRVKLYSASGASPSAELATLTGNSPSGTGTSNYPYTCSGSACALAADTTYFVVMDTPNVPATGAHRYFWMITTSDSETLVPASNGWSVANDGRYSDSSLAFWYSSGGTYQIIAEATPGPSLTASSITTTTATLTITGETGSWWLKRTTPAGGTCTAGESDYTHALSTLTMGTAYTYKAYRDSACAGTAIHSVTFTPPVSAPTSLGAQNQSNAKDGSTDTELVVWWSKPTGATASLGYAVECSANGGTTWTSCHTEAASTGGTFKVAATFTGTANKARVRTTASDANSGWVTVDVPSGTPPGAPTGLGWTQTNSGYRFQWTKPSSPAGAVGYELECQNAHTQHWTSCAGGTIAPTTNTTVTVNVGWIWNFRVRTVKDGVVSAWVLSNSNTGL